MGKHCKTCTCAGRHVEPDVSMRAIRWLLHYGDGLTLDEVGVSTGARATVVEQQIRSIDAWVLHAQLRKSDMPPWYERIRSAGGFGGLRRNGQIGPDGGSLFDVEIPTSV